MHNLSFRNCHPHLRTSAYVHRGSTYTYPRRAAWLFSFTLFGSCRTLSSSSSLCLCVHVYLLLIIPNNCSIDLILSPDTTQRCPRCQYADLMEESVLWGKKIILHVCGIIALPSQYFGRQHGNSCAWETNSRHQIAHPKLDKKHSKSCSIISASCSWKCFNLIVGDWWV